MKVAAVDIGGTEIKYALFSENGNILLQGKIPTGHITSGLQIIEKVSGILNNLSDFDLIGVSTAGQINPTYGTVVYANDNIKGYTGTKIKELLEKNFKVPVTVDNDVNCAAIGELHFGNGNSFRDFICITYGTGIGGAIIVNRELFNGKSFSAGEFGHIITHMKGKLCNCGNHGCYESYASVTTLLREVQVRTGKNLNGKELFELIAFGDLVCKEILDTWIDEVIAGIVSLIHIFNPEGIILGGGIMNENYIIQRIQELIPHNVMASFREVKILKATLGNNAGMYGAMFKALNENRNK